MVKRPAFSMIELIFAIVLIGIAVAGVPQMITRNQQTLESNIVQEGIFAVAAKAAQLLTFRWDDNSQDPNDLLSHSKILDIVATDLNRTNSIFRVGGVTEIAHRRFHSVVTAPSGTLQLNNMTTGLVNFTSGADPTTAAGYKKEYRINIGVSFVGDGDGSYTSVAGNVPSLTYNFPNFPGTVSAVPTNMKMAFIQLQENNSTTGTPSWNALSVLYVYAANIGEVDYFKRTMP